MIFRALLTLYRWARGDGRSRVDPHGGVVDAWLDRPSPSAWFVVRLLAMGVLGMSLRPLLDLTRSQSHLLAFLLWASCMAMGAIATLWVCRRRGDAQLTWWGALQRFAKGPPSLGDIVLALLLGIALINPQSLLPLLRPLLRYWHV